MEKAYYQEYFDYERKHWFFLARAKILMNHIKSITNKQRNLKILNVGAATGYSSQLLSQFGTVTSLEYDKECCDFTNEKLDLNIINGSVLELPFDANSFDLVCAFDVIEHVEDDQLAITEMKRVCKKEGSMVITVPAFNFLWSKHDDINHHFRRYKKNQLLHLFKGSGQLIFHSYFNFWLFFPIAFYRLTISKLKGKGAIDEDTGSDLGVLGENKLVDKLLYNIFSSESSLISNKWRLPVGVSILTSWRK